MSARGPCSNRLIVATGVVVLGLALTGCDSTASSQSTTGRGDSAASGADSGETREPTVKPVSVATNVTKGASDVTVDTRVTVRAAHGTLQKVAVQTARGRAALKGAFHSAKTVWKAAEYLEPGTAYRVKVEASDEAGKVSRSRSSFKTQNLTLDQQTYPSLTPLQNEVVGVGMPVIVHFDIPVKNKAAFERRMTVDAHPATVGSWNWISDQEAHWRPKAYWKPGTRVHVDLDVNGVNAGNGIYGQMSRTLDFKIGRSVIMKTNIATDEMRVMIDGKLARTIPITGGKPGWETRSGTKLIIEKTEVKQMNAATIGIEPGDPNYYNIPDVHYAQRVTYSGEFLHAAPWSVYAQGSSNVSHGCVGMSMANGAWLFSVTHRGDPVEVTGTDRGLEWGNGWTDWSKSFKEYRAGSAL